MEEYFFAKLSDMVRAADRGELRCSDFFSPAEQHTASAYLDKNHRSAKYVLCGAYKQAERRRLIVFPDYMSVPCNNDCCCDGKYCGIFNDWIVPVHIIGSGYVKLSHRDYLGAILSLGIDRAAVGDIVPTDTSGAVVFFTPAIAEYLILHQSPLESVGKDKVKVKRYAMPCDFNFGKNYLEISGVISSARLDSVISVLCGLSREKAKLEIIKGNVRLNFDEAADNDILVAAGDLVSIKGIGRFEIKSLDMKTKKDKLRLFALKFI